MPVRVARRVSECHSANLALIKNNTALTDRADSPLLIIHTGASDHFIRDKALLTDLRKV